MLITPFRKPARATIILNVDPGAYNPWILLFINGDKGFFNVLTGKGEISTEPDKEGGRKKVYGIIRSKKK